MLHDEIFLPAEGQPEVVPDKSQCCIITAALDVCAATRQRAAARVYEEGATVASS